MPSDEVDDRTVNSSSTDNDNEDDENGELFHELAFFQVFVNILSVLLKFRNSNRNKRNI